MPASKVNVRELQAPLKARYQKEPESAKVTMRVKSRATDLADPLHCAVTSEAVPHVTWTAGAHPGVGGSGDVPCSGDLLLAALAACQEITVRMVAAAMGIELESLEVTAIGELDLRGTMGVSREVPVGFTSIRCETAVVVKDDGRPERAQRLLENAERYCVVLNTLRAGVPVETSFNLRTVANPIVVVDYDPAWPEVFQSLKSTLLSAVGDIAVAIEHVGSTAVPGLAAKPIIDLDIVLRSPEDLPQAIERLARLGYAHEGDLGIPGRESFKAPRGTPAHHLYACRPDSESLREHLLFRDYLRAHPDEAARYAALKKELAMRFRQDREGYVQAKHEMIREMLEQAVASREDSTGTEGGR